MSSHPLLSVKQLAEALNCSTSTIYRMVQKNIIPFYDLHSNYRFDLDEVREALKREEVLSKKSSSSK